MNKPVLVIMAAGMGSRFGGLKQIEPIDGQGHMIIDFSIFDAIKAGFEKIYFIIKKENEEVFRENIGDRISSFVDVEYVYQDLNNLPDGYSVPTERVKPWGTGHAVLSCLGKLDGPFAVINADDYYGKSAFSIIYDFLEKTADDEKYNYAMVGYIIENTLTENGYVSRGVCTLDEDDFLSGIQERVRIRKAGEGAEYIEDDGKTWNAIPKGSIVSMNMWGFTNSILRELNIRFEKFLSEKLEANPLKAEFFLPEAIGNILKEEKGRVKVLRTPDKWYGITYKDDKERVVKAIEKLKRDGVYPIKLWDSGL